MFGSVPRALAILWALTVVPVAALDQPIAGGRLVIKDDSSPAVPSVARIAAADGNIRPLGSPADPTVAGATIELQNVTPGLAQSRVFSLPADNWRRIRRGFRYRDPDGLRGPVKDARLVTGVVIARMEGAAMTYVLGRPQLRVGVVLRVGSDRYCAEFGGTIRVDDGERFVAKRAPVPASCPATGVTTTTTTTLPSCSDSQPCVPPDLCSTAVCNVGTGLCDVSGKDCSDGLPCTVDSCDAKTGSCVHTEDAACLCSVLPKPFTCIPHGAPMGNNNLNPDGCPCQQNGNCSGNCQCGSPCGPTNPCAMGTNCNPDGSCSGVCLPSAFSFCVGGVDEPFCTFDFDNNSNLSAACCDCNTDGDCVGSCSNDNVPGTTGVCVP